MSSTDHIDLSLPDNIGTAFIGFLIGSLLFGAVILQTYQYFVRYANDQLYRKLFVISVFLLHLIYYIFSAATMYTSIVHSSHFGNRSFSWAVKGTQMTKTLMMVWVQTFYLRLIWIVSQNLLVDGKQMKLIRGVSFMIFLYSLVVGGAYLAYTIEVSKYFVSSSKPMQLILYVAHGSIVMIDCTIAGVLSYILFKMCGGDDTLKIKSKATAVVNNLAYHFIGTAMLTALTTIITVSLYVAKPSSAVCLAIDFSVPGLYANAVLNLLNSKKRLSKKMKGTLDPKVSSALFLDNFPDTTENEVK